MRPLPHFQEELTALKARLLVMGGLAEDAVRRAVNGLAGRDQAALDLFSAVMDRLLPRGLDLRGQVEDFLQTITQ